MIDKLFRKEGRCNIPYLLAMLCLYFVYVCCYVLLVLLLMLAVMYCLCFAYACIISGFVTWVFEVYA